MDASEPAEGSFEALFAEAVCGLDSSRQEGARGNDELPAAGSVLAERYRIDRLLGQGGMGCVFSGHHVITGKRVAIKWLRGDPVRRKDAALRMAREARAAGRIHHPNVVDVYDAAFAGERPFLVMELLDGESLEERLSRGPLEAPYAVSLLLQVLRGVAAAHAHGIVHRDLKPANIFLCRDGEGRAEFPKVLDFGISKLRADGEDDLMVTDLGVQVGTPIFMAPEQVRGDPLDGRADVYAMSVTLHYMLTCKFPFEARVRGELFAKVLTERPISICEHNPKLPAGLAAVILKGLERDPTRRFASVTDMAQALTPFCIAQRPSRFAERALRLAASRNGRTTGAVLLGLLAVGWLAASHLTGSGPATSGRLIASSPISANNALSRRSDQAAVAQGPLSAAASTAQPDNSRNADTAREPSSRPHPERGTRPRAMSRLRKPVREGAAAPQPPPASVVTPAEEEKLMGW